MTLSSFRISSGKEEDDSGCGDSSKGEVDPEAPAPGDSLGKDSTEEGADDRGDDKDDPGYQ